MKIGIIQASSQAENNDLLHTIVKNVVPKTAEVINFGSFKNDDITFSYVETALLISLLISTKSIDFVVTGCSSGQGMMLACNALPAIICGYTPTAIDARLFSSINNGNVVSLPLGFYSDFTKEIEISHILTGLFEAPLGVGYPPKHACRKIADANFVKKLYSVNQNSIVDVLKTLDDDVRKKIATRKDIFDYIFIHGQEKELIADLQRFLFI